MTNNQPKLHLNIIDVMRAAIGLAAIDGGFVIAVQIINFLASYFGMRIPNNLDQMESLSIFNQTNFLILIMSMLNLAVIIYRITGLARGVKYSALFCYQQAIRRWPSLIILYLLGSILVLAFALPILKIFNLLAMHTPEQFASILMFLLLTLIPYGIFACIFVVDQQNTPMQAIVATWKLIKDQISINLAFKLSLLYGIPGILGSILAAKYFGEYIGLFNAIWFLYCHIVTIIVYTGTLIKATITPENQKLTTIIV